MRILIAPVAFLGLLAPGRPANTQVPATARADGALASRDTLSAETRADDGAPAADRRTFSYVATGRRDPFLPVSRSEGSHGPSGGELEVLGIISHTDPRMSVVVVRALRAGAQEVSAPGDPDSGFGGIHRLRLGDRIGNALITSIRADHIAVEVEEPHGVVRLLLGIPRARRGARR